MESDSDGGEMKGVTVNRFVEGKSLNHERCEVNYLKVTVIFKRFKREHRLLRKFTDSVPTLTAASWFPVHRLLNLLNLMLMKLFYTSNIQHSRNEVNSTV